MLRTCTRCRLPYSFERSRAELRLTYCGVLCEQAAARSARERHAFERLIVGVAIPVTGARMADQHWAALLEAM